MREQRRLVACIPFLILSACMPADTIRQADRSLAVQRIDRIQSQQLTIERDDVRVTVATARLGRKDLEALAVRPMTRKDFEPILKREYVNYAGEEAADLLTLYNSYSGNLGLIPDLPEAPAVWQRFFYWMVDKRGNPRYTFLKVMIENKRSETIRLQPFSSFLWTDTGEELRAFSKEELKDEQEEYLSNDLYGPHPSMWAFKRENRRRFEKVLDKNLFSAQSMAPGESKEGIIVFEQIHPDVSWFSFVFPGVAWGSAPKAVSIDFEFEFSAK